MPKLNARLISRLWDFCAPEKPAKWQTTRYTYLHDPYVVDGRLMATDTYRAIVIDVDTGLDTGAHMSGTLRSIKYGKRDEVIFDSGHICYGDMALRVETYSDARKVPDLRKLINQFETGADATRFDPTLLAPYVRLGKEMGWNMELLSDGMRLLVSYYEGNSLQPVVGLVMGVHK